jgi:hypothetical protein
MKSLAREKNNKLKKLLAWNQKERKRENLRDKTN